MTKSTDERVPRTVGICTIVSIRTMQVFTYVLKTYELALAQAVENQKGVTVKIERQPERLAANGLRETIFTDRVHGELIQVQELEIGDAVLEVPR